MKIRASRAGEEDELGRAAFAAFRNGELANWQRFFREHSARRPSDTLVCEASDFGGEIAGQATALDFTMRLAGADVPARGISAVAVLPQYRRRGVADRLMKAHLRRMRARGQALSLLYPFSVRFYAKYGYATAEWLDQLRVPPACLPAGGDRARVRPLDADRDRAAVRTLYQRARARGTGMLERSEWWWRARVHERATLGAICDGGYLLYEVPDQPAFPQQHCLVREFIWDSAAAFRALLGFLAGLGEQFALVELNLPRGDGALLLEDLVQPEGSAVFKHAATVVGGVMARLVDVPGAFALHPGAARMRGRIGLDVRDPVFRSASYDVDDGRVAAGVKARERLALGAGRLAQIYFGAPARLMLAQGLIEGSERAAALLDRVCAGPPLYLSRLNFF